MAGLPSMPNIPGGGRRQQRAAQIKAEMEAKTRLEQGDATSQEPDAEGSAAGESANGGPRAEDTEEQGTGPVGQGDYVVKEGDCISSIAKDAGHFWEKIWNNPANAELKEVRQDPNVLLPGDRVTIPELQKKEEPGETEMRHRFVRCGEPEMFRLCILCEDEPRRNEPYTLEVDGREHTGTTDTNGYLECSIPGNARRGKLIIGGEGDQQVLDLTLGAMDPIEALSGVQARLNNLGFNCGRLDGKLGPRTERAIKDFQTQFKLQETGRLDQQTHKKLEDEYADR